MPRRTRLGQVGNGEEEPRLRLHFPRCGGLRLHLIVNLRPLHDLSLSDLQHTVLSL